MVKKIAQTGRENTVMDGKARLILALLMSSVMVPMVTYRNLVVLIDGRS